MRPFVVLFGTSEQAEHDARLFAGRGVARAEAAVRHAADHAGALQRLHGGQGIVGDVGFIREGDRRIAGAELDAELPA